MLTSIKLDNVILLLANMLALYFLLEKSSHINSFLMMIITLSFSILTAIAAYRDGYNPFDDSKVNVANDVMLRNNIVNANMIFRRLPILNPIFLYYYSRPWVNTSKIHNDWNVSLNTENANDRIFIIHIGESARNKEFLQYIQTQKPNNNGMTIFNGVISPSVITRLSVPRILSVNKDHSNYNPNLNAIDLFNKIGYETFWVSNQGQSGLNENEISFFAKRAKNVHFENYQYVSAAPDVDLLPRIKSIISNSDNNKAIFFHGMGSHSDFCNRIKTPPEDSSQCYNESIKETFNFNKSLVKYLRSNNIPFTLIYFSDHGLNDDFIHGTGNNTDLNSVSVPFYIWRNSDKKQEIVNVNYNLRNFIYTLLDIANIDKGNIKSIRSEHDDNNFNLIINDNFNAQTVDINK